MARYGVKFGIYRDGEFHEQLFPFDAIPRVITHEDFKYLEKGLIQRVDALNLFLNDIYGEKKIIKDKVVPEEFVFISSGYLPQCEGIIPPKNIYSHISGIDLVLGKDGQWYILEDNLRIPSGASYPMIAREICRRVSPATFGNNSVEDNRNYATMLRETLEWVNTGGIPVIMTPGRYNAAYHLYWLGRYTERVYTTLRMFFHIYDRIIEQPEGIYETYCKKLNIPNIYTSNQQFVQSYLFGEDNPDSVLSNMKRAYDNAVVLRDELSTAVLSYVQLALDTFEACKKTTAPLLELQQVIDYLLAFWGGADDYIDQEECRNILKCGKYVERLDLCLRLEYHTGDLEKEYRKLCNRLEKTSLNYHAESLGRLGDIILREENPEAHYREALGCLGSLFA